MNFLEGRPTLRALCSGSDHHTVEAVGAASTYNPQDLPLESCLASDRRSDRVVSGSSLHESVTVHPPGHLAKSNT